MGYKSAADGVTKTGRTKGKNLGDSGPTMGIEKGPKHGPQKLGKMMKAMGRNLARAKNQG
jgi:hypothetical protein